MSATLYDTLRASEKARLHSYIERTMPDSVRLNMTLAGERLEIDVFEDTNSNFLVFAAMNRSKAERNCEEILAANW